MRVAIYNNLTTNIAGATCTNHRYDVIFKDCRWNLSFLLILCELEKCIYWRIILKRISLSNLTFWQTVTSFLCGKKHFLAFSKSSEGSVERFLKSYIIVFQIVLLSISIELFVHNMFQEIFTVRCRTRTVKPDVIHQRILSLQFKELNEIRCKLDTEVNV